MTSLVIVAGAALGLVWGKYHRRKFKFERGSPCGCAGSSGSGSQSSIVFRARKGERPVVQIKMR